MATVAVGNTPARPRKTATDGYTTDTSRVQSETEDVLLQHLPNSAAQQPTLNEGPHKQWLARNLVQGFPARYQAYDASQPWLMYWTLQSFCALQVGMDPQNKQKIIDKLMASQHPDGGFGGGPGQFPHLLPTYASVCALSIVGRPGPRGGWDEIDRTKMYSFFMSLKQPDGSFTVSLDAEVDVRGTYCLLVCAYLLNLLTPELVHGTAAFIASCQTYEGGFSSASQPNFAPSAAAQPGLLRAPRPPLGEAHGGYTFCALASWVLLRPFVRAQAEADAPRIDERRLLRWLVNMQGGESELGGFKGRTNKLVDGCYSWWVGGAFGLLEALGVNTSRHAHNHHHSPTKGEEAQAGEEQWDDVDDSLYNRAALQEFVMLAGQHPAGGLRDKPPKAADSYHTLSCLSGLSSSQRPVYPSAERHAVLESAWKPSTDNLYLDLLRRTAFAEQLSWTEEEGATLYVGGRGNRLNATHPVFNLTMTHTEGIMSHFYGQSIPQRARPTDTT